MRERHSEKRSKELSADPSLALRELDKYESEQSLKGFIKAAWQYASILKPYHQAIYLDYSSTFRPAS